MPSSPGAFGTRICLAKFGPMRALLHGADTARARLRADELLRDTLVRRVGVKELDLLTRELETVDLLGDPRAFRLALASTERPDGKELLAALERCLRVLEPTDRFVVIVPTALGATHALVALVTRRGGAAERFDRLEGDALEAFIRSRAGVPLDAETVRYLASAFGADSERLLTEIDKATLLALADHREWVRLICPSDQVPDRFGLVDALADKDAARALSGLEQLVAAGEGQLGIVALLASKVRALLLVAASSDDTRIASAVGLNPYALRIARRQVARWTPLQLRRLYGDLLRLDVMLKSAERASVPARLAVVIARACSAR